MMWDVDTGGGCAHARTGDTEPSIPSDQFCYKPKTAPTI